jgi:hypothetical protein
MFGIIDKGCWDVDSQVNTESITLLVIMMQNHFKNFESIDDEHLKTDFMHHVESILESLIIKIGEENQKLKN